LTRALLAAGLLVLAACGSSEPSACSGKGVYAGADVCSRLKSAIDAKCAGSNASFDCEKYFAQTSCRTSQRFCRDGVDKAVADVGATPSCADALTVQLRSHCFD
jgi:hypothetical protein